MKDIEKSIVQLKNKLIRIFHSYIRKRDDGKPCVSCGKYRILQCGHFYSAGKFPRLRFNEDNAHGQCKQCNYYGSMETGQRYEKELLKRIGIEKLERVHLIAAQRDSYKWDKFDLINKINHYKSKK